MNTKQIVNSRSMYSKLGQYEIESSEVLKDAKTPKQKLAAINTSINVISKMIDCNKLEMNIGVALSKFAEFKNVYKNPQSKDFDNSSIIPANNTYSKNSIIK